MPQIPIRGMDLMGKLSQAENIKQSRAKRMALQAESDRMGKAQGLAGEIMGGDRSKMGQLAGLDVGMAKDIQSVIKGMDENQREAAKERARTMGVLARSSNDVNQWNQNIDYFVMQGRLEPEMADQMRGIQGFQHRDAMIMDSMDMEKQLDRMAEQEKPKKLSSTEEKLLAEGYELGTPEAQKRAKEIHSKSGINIDIDTGDKAPLTKKTLNDVQSDIRSAEQSLTDLSAIADTYGDEFLTTVGRFKSTLGRAADKFGLDPAGLATFNAERSRFSTNVKQFFNQYRKEITGAAASVQELEQLVESLFSDELGPIEFKARYEEIENKMERNLELNRKQAREGLDVGGKIMTHIQYGDVTESDIQTTMQEHGMTREEVMAELERTNDG